MYIAANTLTSIGNFFLFNALTAIGNAWAESKRTVTESQAIYFERRLFRYFTLATLAAMILSIVASSDNNNTLRIASNGIFVGLLVVLLFAIYYYHTQLDVQRSNQGIVDPSKYGEQSFFPSLHDPDLAIRMHFSVVDWSNLQASSIHRSCWFLCSPKRFIDLYPWTCTQSNHPHHPHRHMVPCFLFYIMGETSGFSAIAN